MAMPMSDAFVFFGATGDLAYKKIFPALQALIRRGELDMPIIGMARAGWTLDKLRERARDEPGGERRRRCGGVRQAVARNCSYVDGDYKDPATYDRLKQALEGAARPLHYLAIPPSMFGTVVQGLAKAGCATDARVIVEKPFGRDLASAQALNRTLHAVFPRNRRCSASTTTWARRRCRTCCTSASPTPSSSRSGIATTSTACRSRWPRISACRDAAHFYEEVGAIRDVVQNHLLQVMALLAMDAPVGRDPDAMRAEKLRLFRAMRPLDPAEVVRGQFRGYRDEAGRGPRFAGRDLRRAAPPHRHLALGRRAVLHPRRQVPADHRDRGDGRSQAPAAGDLRRDRRRRHRTISASGSAPRW